MTDDDARIELGWDLLEQGEFKGALSAAEALLAESPQDPEALLLASSARLELGEFERAESDLRQLIDRVPEAEEPRLTLANLHYATCRFEEALALVEGTSGSASESAHACYLQGLILDMLGRRVDADRCFERAAALEPETFPVPLSIEPAQFDRIVEESLEELPARFRDALDNLAILVEDVPSAALLENFEGLGPDLLGLYAGTPLPDKRHDDLPSTPDRVYLFKRNLERACGSAEELRSEITVTLLHEIGHYLGMGEDELAEAGFD